jgi:hypothetical protein
MTENKEEFCGACAMVPIALLGAGAAYGTGSSKQKHKQSKKIIFWVGISTVILSILVAVYYLWIKKCDECR